MQEEAVVAQAFGALRAVTDSSGGAVGVRPYTMPWGMCTAAAWTSIPTGPTASTSTGGMGHPAARGDDIKGPMITVGYRTSAVPESSLAVSAGSGGS